jgi:hypothetical protein
MITAPMAVTAQITARVSPRSVATASHEPMPGRATVVLPTVIASDATTKNQLPDMDIMVFHTRAGVANGSSSRQNRFQGDRPNWRAASSRSPGRVFSDW